MKFRIERERRVRLCMAGASWYKTWIDGEWLLKAPFRHPQEAPEVQTEDIHLPTGDHVPACVQ